MPSLLPQQQVHKEVLVREAGIDEEQQNNPGREQAAQQEVEQLQGRGSCTTGGRKAAG